MTRKSYNWKGGAEIEEHTKKKHKVLKKYLRKYLITRCQFPQQEKFRLSILDGFAGGGLYKDHSYGSPLIFVDVLTKTTNEINRLRAGQGMRPVQVECLLMLNDRDSSAVALLRDSIAPLLAAVESEAQSLHVTTEYYTDPFDKFYLKAKVRLEAARCGNVIFNLDQCGYSHIKLSVIRDIMGSFRSPEIFLTFAIESMLTYLSQTGESSVPLEPEVKDKINMLLKDGETLLSKKEWLGEAERIVFTHMKNCARFVSPFSINNPAGWRYWLMHFANSTRARQVYNEILHEDDSVQAHFGRAGLRMLSYDPQNEGKLYLFGGDSRKDAKEALFNDIPSFVAEFGDAMPMQEFYTSAYNETPAHSDDIHQAMIENPDIEVITESGGKRLKANTIRANDILRLKSQRSLFFLFPYPKDCK